MEKHGLLEELVPDSAIGLAVILFQAIYWGIGLSVLIAAFYTGLIIYDQIYGGHEHFFSVASAWMAAGSLLTGVFSDLYDGIPWRKFLRWSVCRGIAIFIVYVAMHPLTIDQAKQVRQEIEQRRTEISEYHQRWIGQASVSLPTFATNMHPHR